MSSLSHSTAENLKESGCIKQEPDDRTFQLPEDVLCDSCMEDTPSKALKSCLTCMVSYCDAHLRPHLKKSKFQTHRLVDPLHEIDCRTCEVHQLPFSSFCLRDGCCVCLDCVSQEHKGHKTTSIGEARTLYETELQQKNTDICKKVSDVDKTIIKLRSNNELIKSSVQEIRVGAEQQFARLHGTVEEARKKVEMSLEGEQRQALRQAEGILTHLEQRKGKLENTLAAMNKLSKSKSDVDFLKVYSEWENRVTDVSTPTMHLDRSDHLKTCFQALTEVTRDLCDQILSSYSEIVGMMRSSGVRSLKPESQLSSQPDPEIREDFLKYASILSFDPDTTHCFLRMTEGNRRLTNTSPWQHGYPDHPGRFDYWRQAMTVESIYMGKHYIEAELHGEGAHIGLTYKSIHRKGEQNSSSITGSDFSWCIGRNGHGFSAWHACEETPLKVAQINRIAIYVDFHRGLVSFYNVTGPMMRLHSYVADFIEPLYVTAWLSKKDNVVHLVNA